MAGKAGSVVVLDPRNGDVLALTSSPAFPLDRLTGNLDRDEWVRLVRDPMSPLMNRALQGLYPPASVFKIIVAAAGLQEGSLTPMDHIYCNGEFNLGNWTFKDWKPGGHGHVDLHQSIAQSCDIFFYQAGLKVGGDVMAKYAQAFGLGAPTGIDLGGERFGWSRSPRPAPAQQAELAPRRHREHVHRTGQLLVTLLQIARMMAAVANGGVMEPRLVQRVERADGSLAYGSSSQMTERVDLSPVVGPSCVSRWPRRSRTVPARWPGCLGSASRARRGPPRPFRRAIPPRGRTTRGSPPSLPSTIPSTSVVLAERGERGPGRGADRAANLRSHLPPEGGPGDASASPADGEDGTAGCSRTSIGRCWAPLFIIGLSLVCLWSSIRAAGSRP
jgi:hypothetical protein